MTPSVDDELESLPEWNHFSLIEGVLGLSVYFAESGQNERFLQTVFRAIELFNEAGANPGLHAGLAGLGLVVSTYHDDAELLETIDESISTRLGEAPALSCGLRGGLGGLAVYAASRRSANPTLASQVSDHLLRRAVVEGDLAAWPVSKDYAALQGLEVPAEPIHEPGMAHGHAGTLVGLAALAEAGDARARELLVPALNWLRRAAASGDPANAFAWVFFGGLASGLRRQLNVNTWCTGDPGVALAALLAAQVAQDDTALAWSVRLAETRAREILDGRRAGMPDRFDLCCGSSSVANIFLRFFEHTGLELFSKAAHRCLDDVGRHTQVFQTLGLQYGLTGALLALAAPEAGRSRRWDLFFGMSLPTSPGRASRHNLLVDQ